jgi:hypothetical protein
MSVVGGGIIPAEPGLDARHRVAHKIAQIRYVTARKV